jgi:alkylation response protein AidB-like acyl-CoA dehydrogenase
MSRAQDGLDLAFDDTQQAIASAMATLCGDQLGDIALRALDGSFPDLHWKSIAELGVLGLATPEGEGGALELVAALEPLGEAAFPGPLPGALFAVQLARDAERAALARGEQIASVGAKGLFPFAERAGVFFEVDGERVFRVEPESRPERISMLGGEHWGRMRCRRSAEIEAAEVAFALHDLALGALHASLGLALVRATAEHARVRVQFGRALGEFQAVAHPLADRLIELEAARMLARRAACDFDAHAAGSAAMATLRRAAAAARLSAKRAAVEAAHVCHQLFGAVGITLEGPVFARSRRILQLASAIPGEEPARAALAAELGALDTPEWPGAPARSAA